MSAVTPIPVIPTLGAMPLVMAPSDIIDYVLWYYSIAPLSISNTTPRGMISLQSTISLYQGTEAQMISQVQADLLKVYDHYFTPGATVVDVTTSDNGNGTYNLTINVLTVANNQTYSASTDLTVNSNGLLQLTYPATQG